LEEKPKILKSVLSYTAENFMGPFLSSQSDGHTAGQGIL